MTFEMERTKQAVLYLRTGEADQGKLHVVDRQRQQCLRIATLFEIAVIREYADLGCPARFEQQTELQRLLGELWHRRDAAFVVMWDYARLASDMTQLNSVIRRIHGCDAEVATLTGMRAAKRYVEEQQNDTRREV
jgi:hypothetical protein